MAIIHTGLECRGFVAVGAEPTCEHRDGIAVISLYSSENILKKLDLLKAPPLLDNTPKSLLATSAVLQF